MNSYYLDATQVAPPARVASPIQEASAWRDSVLPIGFLVLHIPLALAIHASSMVATIHGCVVMIAGLLVISAPSKTERVAYICAYVAGSELLWRMGKSSLFWETGKYAVALLLLMAIVRSGRGRSTALPMLYFALLVPSTVMMLSTAEGFADARNELSFNLSGPLALTVSAWFFARLSIRRTDMYWLWFALLGPIVGVAFLALFGIATAENFKVAGSSASNAMAAGGYGPNQVSAMLGLGALLCLLYIMSAPPNRALKLAMAAVMLWLAAQCAMTFSRGGLYNLVIAAIPAVLFAIRDGRLRARLIAVALPVCVLGALVVVPKLDEFTEGALTKRFTDTGTTGRAEIAEGDLDLWREEPIMGVGTGQSAARRPNHQGFASHTEYTRLLAEHGALGLAAILVLLGMGVMAVWKARTSEGRAIAAACAVWALVFLTHAGMRLAAPSFVFGLALAPLLPDSADPTLMHLDDTQDPWQV